MSRKNLHNERAHARRNRQSRLSSNAKTAPRTQDEQALSSLSYRKGHLTDEELTLFAELRGQLSPVEASELATVAQTLRRPFKRLRALDLMRYWGVPLTNAQRRMLPWLAGLNWHRSLPDNPGLSHAALAAHLLCKQDFPAFLLEPFAYPEGYPSETLHWDLCRLLATVGSGGGLVELRQIEKFWSWVPSDVFERFLETPPDVPVLLGLIDAFVTSWGGPDWLAEQAYTWFAVRSLNYGLPPVLRVVHELCVQPLSPELARQAALTRFSELPRYSKLFGPVSKLEIPDVMPVELRDWQCCELLTPDDFEAEDKRSDRYLKFYFQDAQQGKSSFWTLHCEDQTIVVKVDVSHRRASLYSSHRRGPDCDEKRVVAVWAQANGLKF